MTADPSRRLPTGQRGTADDASDRRRRILELAGALPNGDRDQLAFQISEISGDRIYEQGGIEISPGDLVIDVGGNFGVAAAHFALQCGAEVHTLEPVPATFAVLSDNLAGIPGTTTHQIGLAATAGPAEMTWFEGGDSVMSSLHADLDETRERLALAGRNLGLTETEAEKMAQSRLAPNTTTCNFETLSGFLRSSGIERVDLLKIDVEGSELEVLRGVDEADWPRIRQVTAEVHEQNLLEKIEALLKAHSFTTVVEQDSQLSGTPIRLLYAVR